MNYLMIARKKAHTMGTIQSYEGEKVTILGAGTSGQGLAFLARRLGAQVFVTEHKESLPDHVEKAFHENGINWETEGHSERALDTNVLVVSSGISPSVPIIQKALGAGVPVMGELDFVVPHLQGKIIGVTGSNGKSTTTALTGFVLEKCGYKAVAAGNIGKALSCCAEENWDYIVIELSSFQLAWAHNLHSHIAIVTNLAPDHIDWHGSYEKYIEAKARLIHLQEPGQWAIVQNRDVRALEAHKRSHVASLFWEGQQEKLQKTHAFIRMGDKKAFLCTDGVDELLFRYEDTSLIGRHNLENVAMTMAALTLSGMKCSDASRFVADFKPLSHRCTFVADIDGVRYIDDSKGTNVAASSTALSSIEGKKVVILGGKGKGEDYGPLAEVVKKEARVAIILGEEKAKILQALENIGFSNCIEVADMEEAVRMAMKAALPGETVLLSPACTSWDMYSSYEKRGEHFQHLVKQYGGKR